MVKLLGFLFLEKPYHGLDDGKSVQGVGVCGGEVTERQGEEDWRSMRRVVVMVVMVVMMVMVVSEGNIDTWRLL